MSAFKDYYQRNKKSEVVTYLANLSEDFKKHQSLEEILLHLLYTNCFPILTYACAVKEYPARQMHDCNTAVNDALRMIFGYNRWQSVKTLRESFGYKSLTELFHAAKQKFHASLSSHQNSVIKHIARISNND